MIYGIGVLGNTYALLWLVYQGVKMLRKANSHAHLVDVLNGGQSLKKTRYLC